MDQREFEKQLDYQKEHIIRLNKELAATKAAALRLFNDLRKDICSECKNYKTSLGQEPCASCRGYSKWRVHS